MRRAWIFLRCMWVIFWSCVRHPFRTSVVDLTTGEVAHIPPSR